MSHGKPWTPAEDAFLIRGMKFKKSQKWIGERLGRTEIAVRSRLVEMRGYGRYHYTRDVGDEDNDYETHIRNQVDGHTATLEAIAPLGTKLWADVVFQRALQAA